MDEVQQRKIDIQLLLNIYPEFEPMDKFFLENNFFNKLAGSAELMMQLKGGLSEEEIRLSWQDDITTFKKVRKQYLLYPDFE